MLNLAWSTRSSTRDVKFTRNVDYVSFTKKISHKLLSALFLVAVIPISIMGFGMYRAAEKTLINSAYMHIQTIAQSDANRLDTWYGERLSDIKVLSGLSSIRDLCSAACGCDSNSKNSEIRTG